MKGNEKKRSVREISERVDDIRNPYDKRRVKFLLSVINEKDTELAKEKEKVSALQTRYEAAIEAIKGVKHYNNGCGCCSSGQVEGDEKVKTVLAAFERGEGKGSA